jgi:hypothetical protein
MRDAMLLEAWNGSNIFRVPASFTCLSRTPQPPARRGFRRIRYADDTTRFVDERMGYPRVYPLASPRD